MRQLQRSNDNVEGAGGVREVRKVTLDYNEEKGEGEGKKKNR